MANLKRSYNVPLRSQWLKVPKYKRAKKAMRALRSFLVRHMKAEPENVKIGPYLNEEVWQNGMKNPPHHVKINTEKNEDGIVLAELDGKPMFELKKKDEGKKEKSAIEEKLESVIGKKGSTPKSSAKKDAKKKAAEKKAEKTEEKKPEVKPETKVEPSKPETKPSTPEPPKPTESIPEPAKPAEPQTPKPEQKPAETKPSQPKPESPKPSDTNSPKQE